ncbi:MAG: glycosyltransferase [Phycisphaerae bacterium]|nr:glycosyltransferase [Phycisphaerae bacterium]
MQEVATQPVELKLLKDAIGTAYFDAFLSKVDSLRRAIGDRTVWHINSTPQGGGVAEMLLPMMGYAQSLGLKFRWLVLEGDTHFFEVTKRIHNNLHGVAGDGGPLGDDERRAYEATQARAADGLARFVKPGDVVICHDPQTTGLVPHAHRLDASVVWRSHIGFDGRNEHTEQAWTFLAPYLQGAKRFIFTRDSYVPPQIDRSRVTIVPPSIDPTSMKNRPMGSDHCRAILVAAGILEGPLEDAPPRFRRTDGSWSSIERAADVIHLGRAPRADRRLVVQVSRWDRLKDPTGVLRGFADYLARDHSSLVLAGPNVSGVADDPEGGRVLDEVFVAWRNLPHEARRHVHIACLPMADREENAAIVNALQRHATVLIQKSLCEGFGLTVTEAMWKEKPVIASAVGGIQDQIEDGVHGLLLPDPSDLEAFATAIARVLDDSDLAARLARNARERVTERFLMTRHVLQYLELVAGL